MMREEKLFSGIYSAGTALAILFTLAGKRLCTVLIGTAIPALKIVKTRISEALRDE